MVIDTTLSAFQIYLHKLDRLKRSIARRQRHRFPDGIYDSKQEHAEFRQFYVREFLERNGLDADMDLKNTVVFWRDGEVVAVTGATFDNSQKIVELLGTWQN